MLVETLDAAGLGLNQSNHAKWHVSFATSTNTRACSARPFTFITSLSFFTSVSSPGVARAKPYVIACDHYRRQLLPRVTRGRASGDASHGKEAFPECQKSYTRGSLPRVPSSLSGTI
jgi:hypothetical protein